MTTAQIADDLATTVNTAARQLQTLDDATVLQRPTPDRWTIKEVIGHLIDSATNNHQRFVRAQFVEEFIFPAYKQNEWVQCQSCNDVDWADLVELWRRYNLHLAHVIRHAGSKTLDTRCVIGDYPLMTLQALMADYVVHIKHHLNKIAERLTVDSARIAG